MQNFNNYEKLFNNSNYKWVLEALQNGVDAKTLFYQMCQVKGVNPDDILKQVNNPNIKK